MKNPNGIAYAGSSLLVESITMPGGHVREVVHRRNAVAFLLYDPARDAVALVRQPRVTAISKKNPEGLVTEVPAGCLESTDIEEEVIREAQEELGISLRKDQVFLLNGGAGLYTSPGWTTEMMILAFATLEPGQCDETHEHFGLQEEGESTQRIWVPVEIFASMEFEDVKTFALVRWFLSVHMERKPEEKNALLRSIVGIQEELDDRRRTENDTQ